jgi:hypothetical protein
VEETTTFASKFQENVKLRVEKFIDPTLGSILELSVVAVAAIPLEVNADPLSVNHSPAQTQTRQNRLRILC